MRSTPSCDSQLLALETSRPGTWRTELARQAPQHDALDARDVRLLPGQLQGAGAPVRPAAGW